MSNDTNVKRFIVVVGNVADGHTFFGPFVTHDEALEWAEERDDNEPWVITELWGPL